MRKRLISNSGLGQLPADPAWIDLQSVAIAEITSEDETAPFEDALTASAAGWRASDPGDQLIRLLFDHPRDLTHIRVAFHEGQVPRTQEFVLRWSADGGRSFHEVVRQQYTFSPPGTTSEVEDYRVALKGVTVLELKIRPDIAGAGAYASIAELRLT